MGFRLNIGPRGSGVKDPDQKPPDWSDEGPIPGVPGVRWSGHLYDYSGYAKANREILFRVANVLRVSVEKTGLENGLISVDRHTRARIDTFRDIRVDPKAPLLRFFGPDYVGDAKRYRICWTMMETYKIHHDMVKMVNYSFDELWTPTSWNRNVFVESGVTIPAHVYNLGVNPLIYRPVAGAKLPPCRLITTAEAGKQAVPDGFIFYSVGLPSFRKGFDVLVEAFDRAFRDRPDAHLVLGITHSLKEWNEQIYKQFAGRKTMIWTLEGQYTEHEMARIYSATNCYVSASRGEGWNLPVCEAAACGVPIIAPDNTSHPEVVGKGALLFPIEGYAVHPEGQKVSGWYRGVPFAVFGNKSVAALSEMMRAVYDGGAEVRERAAMLQETMKTRWSWSAVADRVTARLLEVQP